MTDRVSDIALRRGRVQAAMRERGLRGLVIYFGGQHYMLRMNQLMYLTDFKALGQAALLVPDDGLPTLIVSPEWDLPRAREEAVGVADILAVAPEALAGEIATRARLRPKPFALAGSEGMTVAFSRALLAGLGAEPANADTLESSLAATRTPVELERIEKAAAIADAGFVALRETARVDIDRKSTRLNSSH